MTIADGALVATRHGRTVVLAQLGEHDVYRMLRAYNVDVWRAAAVAHRLITIALRAQ